MLERKIPFKVGIEHAVREHRIGNACSAQTAIGRNRVVLPDAVDKHNVIASNVGLEPRVCMKRKSVNSPARAQPKDFGRKIAFLRIFRRVQRGHFDFMAAHFVDGAKLPESLSRSAAARIHGWDDMQYFHRRSSRELGFSDRSLVCRRIATGNSPLILISD